MNFLKSAYFYCLIVFVLNSFVLQAQYFKPIYPPNQAVVGTSTVRFHFNNLSVAGLYRFQLSSSASFAVLTVDSQNLASTTLILPVLHGQSYFWRYGLQNSTQWSPTYAFTVFIPSAHTNNQLHIAADQLVLNNGDPVQAWHDQSQNQFLFQQANLVSRPTFNQNPSNLEKPVVVFDGSNDFLTGGNILNFGTDNYSIYTLVSGNGVFTGKVGQFSAPFNIFNLSGNATQLNFELAGDVYFGNSISRPSSNFSNISFRFNRALNQILFSANNSIPSVYPTSGFSSPSFSMVSLSDFNLGAYSVPNFPAFLNGSIAEVIAFNTNLPQNIHENVQQYLRFKYHPPVSLGEDVYLTQTLCPQTLSAGKQYSSYLWNTGATTRTITVSKPGTYWVRTTDIYGNQSADTLRIFYPGNLTFNTIYRINQGDTLRINTQLPGSFQVVWNNGTQGNTSQITQQGYYFATITDQGNCAFTTDSFFVEFCNLKSKISLGPDRTQCSGDSLKLLVNTAQLTSFLWNTGSSNSSISLTQSGTYILQVSDVFGCSSADTIQITVSGQKPTAGFTVDSVCVLSIPSISNTSNGNGNPIVSNNWIIQNQQFTGIVPGFIPQNSGNFPIKLIVANSAGCFDSLVKNLRVLPKPVSNFTFPFIPCAGNAIPFTSASTGNQGDSIIQFRWTFPSGNIFQRNPTVAFQNPGQNQVRLVVVSQKGCRDTLIQQLAIKSSDIPASMVQLISPANGELFSTQQIVFKWRDTDTNSYYRLQIASDSLFTQMLFNRNFILVRERTLNFPNPGNYYFRIFAYNACGNFTVTKTFNFNRIDINDPNLRLWFNAGNLNLSNNSRVQNWPNSANPVEFISQNNTNAQPLFRANSSRLNNKQAVFFDGNDFLTGINQFQIGTKDITYIAVASGTGTIFTKTGAPGVTPNLFSSTRTGGNINFEFAGSNYQNMSLPYNLNNPSVKTFSTNRSNMQIRLFTNGSFASQTAITSLSSAGYNFTSTAPVSLGRYSSTGFDVFLNGEIAEILVFDTLLAESKLNTIHQYLRHKYHPPVSFAEDTIHLNTFCAFPITVSGNYSQVTWSDGDTLRTKNITQSGMYRINAIDYFGVASSDSVYIKFPEVNLANTSFCAGDSVLLSITLPTQNFQFLWSDNKTSPQNWIKQQGAYSVQITDYKNCSKTFGNIQVNQNNFPNSLTIPSTLNLCSGDSLLVSGPGQASTILWNTGSTGRSIQILNSGNYSFQATDSFGCIARDTSSVTIVGVKPIADFIADTACFQSASQFIALSTVATGNIISQNQFRFPGNQVIQNNQASFIFPSSGTFNVSLKTITTAGCRDSIVKSVVVKPKPQSLFTYLFAPCQGGSLPFQSTATAPSNTVLNQFQWLFGDGNSALGQNVVHSYSLPGNYNAKHIVTASNGCRDTIAVNIPVTTNDALPQMPVLNSPAPDIIHQQGNINFVWQSVNPNEYHRLQIAADDQFTQLIIDENFITQSQRNLQLNLTSDVYWRVLAYNACGTMTSSNVLMIKIPPAGLLSQANIWFDANTVSGNTGASISAIHNLNNPQDSLSQANAVQRPLLITNQSLINNKSSLRFDGVNDFLQGMNNFTFDTSSVTVFNVGRGTGTFFSKIQQITSPFDMFSMVGNNNQMFVEFSGDQQDFISAPLTNSRYSIVGFNSNRNSLQNQLFINNNVPVTQNFSGITTPNYSFGGQNPVYIGLYFPPNLPFHLNGDLSELILFKRNLSSTEKESVYNYLEGKYSPKLYVGFDTLRLNSLCPFTLTLGSGFQNYVWDNNLTGNVRTFTQSGTYYVEALNSFGVTVVDTFTILFPVLHIPNTAFCRNDSIEIGLNLSATEYQFQWNNGKTTPKIFANQPGQYFVQVFDRYNCQQLSNLAIVQQDDFEVLASLGPDTAVCGGDSIQLKVGFAPGNTYSWSTGSTQPQIEIQSAGVYFLTVQNDNACVATDTVTVTLKGVRPQLTFNFDDLCAGNLTHAEVFPQLLPTDTVNTILWYLPQNINYSGTQINHSFANAGIYPISVEINLSNGCSNSKDTTVQIFNDPVADFSTINNCLNTDITFVNITTLNADSVQSVHWNFGNPASGNSNESNLYVPKHKFTAAGQFSVTLIVENSHLCKDTVQRMVNILQSPKAKFIQTRSCIGDEVIFTDQSNYFSNQPTQQTWHFFDGSLASGQQVFKQFNIYGETENKLIVRSDNGCRDTVSQTLFTNQKPNVLLSYGNLCENTDLRFIDRSNVLAPAVISQLQWNISNLPPVFGDTAVIKLNAGTHQVKLIAQTDSLCVDSFLQNIVVDEKPLLEISVSPEEPVAPARLMVRINQPQLIFKEFTFNAIRYESDSVDILVNNPGNYELEYIGINSKGCRDTLTRSIAVVERYVDLQIIDFEIIPLTGNRFMLAYRLANKGTFTVRNAGIIASGSGIPLVTENFNFIAPAGSIIELKSGIIFDIATKIDYVCAEIEKVEGEPDMNLENNRLCKDPAFSGFELLNVFPNPFAQTINVYFSSDAETEVTIDVIEPRTGKLVYNEKVKTIKSGFQQIEVSLPGVSNGFYMLKLSNGQETKIRKLVKQ